MESAILGKGGVASPPAYKEKLWRNTRKLFCRVARYVTRIQAACATQGGSRNVPLSPPTITIKGGRIRMNYRRKRTFVFLRRIIAGNNSTANICTLDPQTFS